MPAKRTRSESTSDHEYQISGRQAKRSRLNNPGADDRERGQTRTARDGGMLGYDPNTGAWVPAVYHSNIRDELLALTDSNGHYVHPRAQGTAANDRTAYLASQHNWGPERDQWHHIPGNILNRLEKREYKGLNHDQRPGLWYHRGLLVLDHDNHPVRLFPELPDTLSSVVEGWLIEAICRLDHRITRRDIWARLPLETETGAEGRRRRSEKELPGQSAIGNRRLHFREDEGLLAWQKRKSSKKIEAMVKGRLSREDLRSNSTARVGTPDADWVRRRKALRGGKGSTHDKGDTSEPRKRATRRTPHNDNPEDPFAAGMAPPPPSPITGYGVNPSGAQNIGMNLRQIVPAPGPYYHNATSGVSHSASQRDRHLGTYPPIAPAQPYNLRSSATLDNNTAGDVGYTRRNIGTRRDEQGIVPSYLPLHPNDPLTINPQDLLIGPPLDPELPGNNDEQLDEPTVFDPYLPASFQMPAASDFPIPHHDPRESTYGYLPTDPAGVPQGRRRRRNEDAEIGAEDLAREPRRRHGENGTAPVTHQSSRTRPSVPQGRLAPYQSNLDDNLNNTNLNARQLTNIAPRPERVQQPQPTLPMQANNPTLEPSSQGQNQDASNQSHQTSRRGPTEPLMLDFDLRPRRPLTPDGVREVQIVIEFTRQDLRSWLRGTGDYNYPFPTDHNQSYNDQLRTLTREFDRRYRRSFPGQVVPILRSLTDWKGSWQSWRIEDLLQC